MSKWILGSGVAALMLAMSAPVHAQARPADLSRSPNDSAQVSDTSRVDADKGEVRVHRSLLMDLPLDDADDLRRFLPGYMENAQGDALHRARGAYLATYVDGVPVRPHTTAPALLPPLTALRAVTLTPGGVRATHSGASVIDYSTRFAPGAWTADARLHTDAMSPGGWSADRTRFDLAAGGPVPGLPGLRVFAAGEVQADQHLALPEGGPPVWLQSGTDTTVMLVNIDGDSVAVIVPEYVAADPDRLPLGSTGRSAMVAGLTYERGDGAFGVRYYRNGARTARRSLDQLYNPDAWRGADDVSQMVNLSIAQALPWGLTARAVLSHQRFDVTRGMLDPAQAASDADPLLGAFLGSPPFIFGDLDGQPSDVMLLALRSGVLPPNELVFTSQEPHLLIRQGVPGVNQTLRLNPYAARTSFPITGVGLYSDAAGDWESERRWYGRGSVSRDIGAISIELGGELDQSDITAFSLPLAGGTPRGMRESISSSAAFVQTGFSLDRLDVGAGVRLERHGTDALVSRLPGFVTFVPDSLRGDAYIMTAGDGPWEERLQRLEECGGAATAADRTNPITGVAVCRDNFVAVEDRTAFAPRIHADYDLGRLSVRAGYGSYIQPAAMVGDANVDGSSVGASHVWRRPVDPVRENIAELGLRLSTSSVSWVDVALYHLDVTNPVVVQITQFTNPVTNAPISRPITANGESETTLGFELSALQQLGRSAGVLASFGVSRFDEQGAGKPRTDPLRASAMAWLDLTPIGRSGPLAAIFSDMTIHATASYAQGARFTRLTNVGEGWLAGRLQDGFGGMTAEEPLSSRLPAQKTFDMRIARGWNIRGVNAQFVADLRNPFGIDNVHTVYAETGTTENALYRDRRVANELTTWSGLGMVRDMVIDEWVTENELNRYMLRQAEQRFGNGDGIFTVEEMMASVDSYVSLREGAHWFSDGGRRLQLGIEVQF